MLPIVFAVVFFVVYALKRCWFARPRDAKAKKSRTLRPGVRVAAGEKQHLSDDDDDDDTNENQFTKQNTIVVRALKRFRGIVCCSWCPCVGGFLLGVIFTAVGVVLLLGKEILWRVVVVTT